MYRNYEASAHSAMSTRDFARTQASFINRVYGWMSGGLALTGLLAWFVANTPALITPLVQNRILFFGLLIGEFLLVATMSAASRRMSAAALTGCFLFYSALNGVTMSVIFYFFTMSSIAATFFATSLTFGAMSLFGYVTKRDLTKLGSLCFMALVGLIIASIVNIFWANSTLYWIVTYVGILIFIGLIAYDTQKIKEMSLAIGDDLAASEVGKKYAIMGALELYLDFINLFLLLLRLFGRGRD
jgi:FtsH-binding integral membrane protein